MRDLDSIIYSYLGSNDILKILIFKKYNTPLTINLKFCNLKRKEFIEQNHNFIIKTSHLIDKNIDWHQLSLNENAISLLQQHLDKINWCNLCINSNSIEI